MASTLLTASFLLHLCQFYRNVYKTILFNQSLNAQLRLHGVVSHSIKALRCAVGYVQQLSQHHTAVETDPKHVLVAS